MFIRSLAVASFLVILSGCASYAPPGRGADMTAVGAPEASQYGAGTSNDIRASFDKRPLANFPAGIAVARVQASGYSSATAKGWGEGRYSIVTTRDVETDQQIQRLMKLPQVRGIAPVGRLLIDGRLDSDYPLRQAAAKLQADMVLIYTFDTTFTTENKIVPLSVITLGLSPNEQVRVTSTASAILLDTRNAYIYGLAEATSQKKQMTSSWQSSTAIDETRRAAETEAFDKLVGEFERTWTSVVSNQKSPAGQVSVSN